MDVEIERTAKVLKYSLAVLAAASNTSTKIKLSSQLWLARSTKNGFARINSIRDSSKIP